MAVGDMNSGTSLTDSTLSEVGLPADAAATGDALAEKLDSTGGTMSGNLHIAVSDAEIIMLSSDDGSISAECQYRRTDTGASLGCGVGASGKNMGLYDGTHKRWLVHTDASTGKIYIGGTLCTGFVTASGSNYVRFSDGTQICWGNGTMPVKTSNAGSNFLQYSGILTVNFPVAFSSSPVGIVNGGDHAAYWNGNSPWTSKTSIRVSIASNGMADSMQYSYIAIGRWK